MKPGFARGFEYSDCWVEDARLVVLNARDAAERGFAAVTAREIAGHAGVTERTFFRHFPDKREVLFDGAGSLSAILTEAVRDAPATLGPWETLLRAFQAATPLLVENRRFSGPRRRIIASSLSLQERELAKTMSLTTTLASALQDRGVPDKLAWLAAQIGMAAFGQAFSDWLEDGAGDLDDHLRRAFRDVCDLTSPGQKPTCAGRLLRA